MSNAEFGPLIIETDVDVAVVKTLRLWLPTYLTQFERERDLAHGKLARPKPESFTNALTDDEFLDHQLPAIIVTTAETNDAPRPTQWGYDSVWAVTVSAVVRGATAVESRAIGSAFSGCVRRALIQQPDLDGFAQRVDWMSANLIPWQDEDARYLTAGVNTFLVYVDSAIGNDGPFIPDPADPDPTYPPADPSDPDQVYSPLASVDAVTMSVILKEDD